MYNGLARALPKTLLAEGTGKARFASLFSGNIHSEVGIFATRSQFAMYWQAIGQKSTRMLILINGDRCSITYDLRTKFQSESWEVETLQRGAVVILKRDYPALLVGVLPENQTILSAPGMLLSQQATTSSV